MGRTTYIVAAGSNRCGRHGRPEAEVAAAFARIRGRVTPSPIVASAPLGPSIRRFANAVALVETRADPEKLLRRLQKIESRFGRRRARRWGARVIDLDIILWSEGCWASPSLTIPHPAFRTRRFVLDPLVRLAPGWCDPVTNRTVRQLHARLTRRAPVPRRHDRW